MRKILDREIFKRMVADALAAIREHEADLSALDAATGDGDHGTAMVAALAAATQAADVEAPFKQMLFDMGWAVMGEASGSTSTLIGALFMGMSDGLQQSDTELDAAGVARMFAAALASVRQQTKAEVGDKTLMDALIPAVEALQAANIKEQGIASMLEKATSAASQGAQKTKDLVAKFGRARNLGENAVGHVDPGATSISLIFESFANTFAS
ncbi:MAG TPA: DAK2 domain-containing protein [Candidatus Sumerlaeota bacterium]|nr:DAK2 domain-containing protein [Candidatus Sumerlaeota bacterium]HPS03437.1 DAK2 domain-containing protein [Candidatus Sumerlaeota bacterium]